MRRYFLRGFLAGDFFAREELEDFAAFFVDFAADGFEPVDGFAGADFFAGGLVAAFFAEALVAGGFAGGFAEALVVRARVEAMADLISALRSAMESDVADLRRRSRP